LTVLDLLNLEGVDGSQAYTLRKTDRTFIGIHTGRKTVENV